jgi:hypothetical protein
MCCRRVPCKAATSGQLVLKAAATTVPGRNNGGAASFWQDHTPARSSTVARAHSSLVAFAVAYLFAHTVACTIASAVAYMVAESSCRSKVVITCTVLAVVAAPLACWNLGQVASGFQR